MEYWYWIVLALGVNITGFPPGLSATQFLGTSDPSLAAVCSSFPSHARMHTHSGRA